VSASAKDPLPALEQRAPSKHHHGQFQLLHLDHKRLAGLRLDCSVFDGGKGMATVAAYKGNGARAQRRLAPTDGIER
jgi:hypothetical protein